LGGEEDAGQEDDGEQRNDEKGRSELHGKFLEVSISLSSLARLAVTAGFRPIWLLQGQIATPGGVSGFVEDEMSVGT
jgi:hypothetical protein